MYVYFIRAGNRGAIKIGVATDIKQRIDNLQTGNPFELKVLALIPCSCIEHAYETERRIHKFFEKQRIRGEWFQGNIEFSKIGDMKVDMNGENVDEKLRRETKNKYQANYRKFKRTK